MFNKCSKEDCWHSLKESGSLFMNWLAGGEGSSAVYGPGSAIVKDIMTEDAVKRARELFYSKNMDALTDGSSDSLAPVTNYGAKFGINGFFASRNPLSENFSPARFYIGTYSINIYPVDGGRQLYFYLENNSDLTSLGHQFGFNGSLELPSYSRPYPGGRLGQVYWWTENRR